MERVIAQNLHSQKLLRYRGVDKLQFAASAVHGRKERSRGREREGKKRGKKRRGDCVERKGRAVGTQKKEASMKRLSNLFFSPLFFSSRHIVLRPKYCRKRAPTRSETTTSTTLDIQCFKTYKQTCTVHELELL